MAYSDKSKGALVTGAILLLVAVLFLFLPFIATHPFSLSSIYNEEQAAVAIMRQTLEGGLGIGISPISGLVLMLANLQGIGAGGALLAILFMLLVLGAVVMCVLTAIMALTNKKYFAPWISLVIYGVLCILMIVVAIIANNEANRAVGFNLGSVIVPTIWLFLGLACTVVPVFLLRRYVAPPPPPEPVTIPVEPDLGEVTIPSSKTNKQGVQVQVRYSDDSGTHVVKRQILTDHPLTVGRSDSCSVVLADSRASSVHARLKYDDLNGLVIEDNNSTNGIQVNGETVMKLRKISREDSIRIGDSKLQFTVVGSLDDFDGEKTIAAGDRYHEPLKVRLNFTDDSGPRIENVMLKETAMIGSMRECEVSIDSTTVSHKHARLVNLGGGRIAIEDNASTNGVIVNGERVDKRTPVAKGDVITLGDVNIRVTL